MFDCGRALPLHHPLHPPPRLGENYSDGVERCIDWAPKLREHSEDGCAIKHSKEGTVAVTYLEETAEFRGDHNEGKMHLGIFPPSAHSWRGSHTEREREREREGREGMGEGGFKVYQERKEISRAVALRRRSIKF